MRLLTKLFNRLAGWWSRSLTLRAPRTPGSENCRSCAEAWEDSGHDPDARCPRHQW
jgi:hypothetical protein